jgi:hypothetical protein
VAEGDELRARRRGEQNAVALRATAMKVHGGPNVDRDVGDRPQAPRLAQL